jgi:hypothetical protein
VRERNFATAEIFGLNAPADDAGHVRANQFNGVRDPLNFVPESPFTNQYLFRQGEKVAEYLASHCTFANGGGPNDSVLYEVSFEYNPAAPANALRPTFISTRIDLLHDCTNVRLVSSRLISSVASAVHTTQSVSVCLCSLID